MNSEGWSEQRPKEHSLAFVALDSMPEAIAVQRSWLLRQFEAAGLGLLSARLSASLTRSLKEKPPRPTSPTLTALGKGKLRVSWVGSPERRVAGSVCNFIWIFFRRSRVHAHPWKPPRWPCLAGVR